MGNMWGSLILDGDKMHVGFNKKVRVEKYSGCVYDYIFHRCNKRSRLGNFVNKKNLLLTILEVLGNGFDCLDPGEDYTARAVTVEGAW